MPLPSRKIGWISAASIVLANMIGTGVFTSLGTQLNYVSNTWTVLLLWVLCGVMSLFGAFTYAEIGVRLPRNGGEYYFLSKIYHPVLGYLSGWVSITVGFAASIALAAIAIGNYLSPLVHLSPIGLAVTTIVIVSLIHSFSVQRSSRFQNVLILIKLLLIILIIVVGLFAPTVHAANLDWSYRGITDLFSPAAAVAFVFVVHAFSGWNAAAYITEEIEDPARNLPRALIVGTVVASLLFVLLQWAFLRQVPLHMIQGKVEVGQIVGQQLLGVMGGRIVSILITILLISSTSAMIWVGSRVMRAMAANYRSWAFFDYDNRQGIPVRAIWLQTTISLFLVSLSSFEEVMTYSGFVLQLFTFLTVMGLLILRRRQADAPWRSPLFPYVQLLFLALCGWSLIYLLLDKPYESLLGLLNLVAGLLSYGWDRLQYRRNSPTESSPNTAASSTTTAETIN